MSLREQVLAMSAERSKKAYGAITGDSDYDRLALYVMALTIEACAQECDRMAEAHYMGALLANRLRALAKDGET